MGLGQAEKEEEANLTGSGWLLVGVYQVVAIGC